MFCKAFGAALAVACLWVPSLASATGKGGTIEHAELLDSLKLDGQLFHVQGVDLDADHIFVTSVDLKHRKGYIHEFDRATGAFQRRLELTDGVRYHPGGLSIVGGSIWVPVAEKRPNSTAVLEQIDAATLQVVRKIHVADHLGCVAASGSELIAGNWNSKLLYVFDAVGGQELRVVPNPSATRYQDMKLVDGQLIAGGQTKRRSGTIDWIDPTSMKLVRTLKAGATDHRQAYTREGMTVSGGELYVLPEDGPSRLFRFHLDAEVPAAPVRVAAVASR
jgi:hypothetical protein